MTYKKKEVPHSQKDADRSIRRIKELMQMGVSQAEMVEILRDEGYRTIRLKEWTLTNLKQCLWKLRWDLKSWYGLAADRCGLDVPAPARSAA